MAGGGLEGVAISAAGGVLLQGGPLTFSYIRSVRDSSKNMKKNYELLNKEVNMLCAVRDDHEAVVRRHRTKKTTNAYSIWEKQVTEILQDMGRIETRYRKEIKRSKWKIWQRSRFSQELLEKCEQVHKLFESSNFRGGFLVEKPPERVLQVNAPKVHEFPTLFAPLGKILNLLSDRRIKGIGVHGMVGVGKTTVLQNLNNHDTVAKLFDIVIWVKVSVEDSQTKLQQEVARRLKLDLESVNHPEEVARTINEELKDKRYLLLLDEVMDYLNLCEVGIPDTENGSKVVLTTKFRHVCNLMVDRIIEVDPLSPQEAWKMFQEIVKDVIGLPDVEQVAQLVANRCARLPLLIKTVASSFKLKDSASLWRAGLADLELWPEVEIQGLREMYKFLEFCYNDLIDDNKKKCFLYTALFPGDEDISADLLLECWAAEGFLGTMNSGKKFQDLRDKGYSIMEHLTNVSLLEKSERMINVRMNKCIRQVALYISSQEPTCKFLVKTNENLQEPPNEEDWQQADRISLIKNNLHCLPEYPNCSTLLTLLLQQNLDLEVIPRFFFDNMEKLLVLDLCSTRIVLLPSSLSKLTNLQVLFLNDCIHLVELPAEIASLKQLQVLDIRQTRVKFIPLHIQGLIHLRCLRLSFTGFENSGSQENEMMSSTVISSLSLLEELIIEVEFYAKWRESVKAITEQVATLTKLTTLWFCFPSSEILKNFMQKSPSWRSCGQLTSFQFFIGCQNSHINTLILEFFQYKINRYTRYSNGEGNEDTTTAEILAETDAFELFEHKDIVALTDLGIISMNQLRGCLIESCNELTTIIDGNAANSSVLPNLEQLYLRSLPKLKSIWERLVQPGSFCKLATLELHNCPLLKNIFSGEVIQLFSEIQRLVVVDCGKVEQLIVESENTKVEPHVLPKLKTLVLRKMPELRFICASDSLAWPSLETIEIKKCPGLCQLPFSNDNAAKLRTIEGELSWWEVLQWQHTEVKERLDLICILD